MFTLSVQKVTPFEPSSLKRSALAVAQQMHKQRSFVRHPFQ